MWAAAPYGGAVQAMIGRLKFRGEARLAAPLASLLVTSVPRSTLPGVDALVPVPLYAGRLRERGYDQAALLARRAARGWSLRLELSGLRRRRDTPPQSGLSAAQRRHNLVGAFGAEPARVEGRRLLLLDDVVTTGSTLWACARALFDGGGGGVDCVTGARALAPEETL